MGQFWLILIIFFCIFSPTKGLPKIQKKIGNFLFVENFNIFCRTCALPQVGQHKNGQKRGFSLKNALFFKEKNQELVVQNSDTISPTSFFVLIFFFFIFFITDGCVHPKNRIATRLETASVVSGRFLVAC